MGDDRGAGYLDGLVAVKAGPANDAAFGARLAPGWELPCRGETGSAFAFASASGAQSLLGRNLMKIVFEQNI